MAMDARDHPSTADYAMHAAQDAQGELRTLRERLDHIDQMQVELLHQVARLTEALYTVAGKSLR
jgi:hypothetical protein